MRFYQNTLKEYVLPLIIVPFLIIVGFNLLSYILVRPILLLIVLLSTIGITYLRYRHVMRPPSGKLVMQKSIHNIRISYSIQAKLSDWQYKRPKRSKWRKLKAIGISIAILMLMWITYCLTNPLASILPLPAHFSSDEGLPIISSELIKIGVIFLSFFAVGCIAQIVLRKRHLSRLSWVNIFDVWLKWTGVSTVTVGGFGIIANGNGVQSEFFKLTANSPYVNIHLMTSIYFVLLLTGLFALMLSVLGRSITDDVESNTPRMWFLFAFIFTWVTFVGQASMLLCGIALTFHAHITHV